MSTLNRSDPDYGPVASPDYSRPVQVGSVRGLSIAVTPGGQGILGWWDVDANELRVAVVETLQGCFEDNIVGPADVRVAWSGAAGGRTIHAGVIAVIGGALLAFVSHFRWQSGVENNGKVECYVANDVEDPTSWTLRGTVQNHNASVAGGTTSFESKTMGPPTVLSSGRWLLPANTWRTYGGSALTDGVGVFTSDDAGASWATRVDSRSQPLLGGNSGCLTTSIGYDPPSGLLVYGRGPSGGNPPIGVFHSADGGVSWSLSSFIAGVPHFFMDDTQTVYAAIDIGTVRRIFLVPDPLNPSTWVDTTVDALNIGALDETVHGFQTIPLFSGGVFISVAFSAGDRIASITRGWMIRRVGLG